MSDQIAIIKAVSEIVATIVAREFGLKDQTIFTKTRSTRTTVLARQTTIYLLHVLFRCSPTQIGLAVNRDRSTVRHACNTIEDYRDDPVFDDRISKLEDEIAFLADVRVL